MEHIFDKQPEIKKHGHTQAEDYVKSYPSRTVVHAKLEITKPGDEEEREADAAASQVVDGGVIRRHLSQGGSHSGLVLPSNKESVLNESTGRGNRMPEGLQAMMERGFNRDFSQVRFHTDATAAELNDSIHAKAFTYENDIYFNQNQFSPDTHEGQLLIAHELAHVEQGNKGISRKTVIDEKPNDIMCQDLDCYNYKFTEEEKEILKADLREAVFMLTEAIKNIETDPDREVYFGPGNDYGLIKKNLEKMLNALKNKSERVLLHKDTRDWRKSGLKKVPAFVSKEDNAIDIAFRDLYFDKKSLTDGGRAATLIHELSHDVIKTNTPSVNDEKKNYYSNEEYDDKALTRACDPFFNDYVIQNASNYELYCLSFSSKKTNLDAIFEQVHCKPVRNDK